jgi:hypothetical protein
VPTSAVVNVAGCALDAESGSGSNRTVFNPASRIVLPDETGWLAQPATMVTTAVNNSVRMSHADHCDKLFW